MVFLQHMLFIQNTFQQHHCSHRGWSQQDFQSESNLLNWNVLVLKSAHCAPLEMSAPVISFLLIAFQFNLRAILFCLFILKLAAQLLIFFSIGITKFEGKKWYQYINKIFHSNKFDQQQIQVSDIQSNSYLLSKSKITSREGRCK